MNRRLFLPIAVLLAIVVLFTGSLLPAFADDPQPLRWVPIGASYAADTLQLFAAQAVEYNSDDVVQVRLLPITYGFDAYVITPKERAENLELLQRRAGQLLDACEAELAAPATSCQVTIIDMQIRSDAEDPDKVALLGPDVDGVYIPGGDQVIAIEVIRDTPAETALGALFAAGAPIGGNSAGAAVQSYHMIAGYTGDNYPWDGLRQGAVDLWYGDPDPDQRGLAFGLMPAVIEQHVLQRGRLARLLQAVNELPESHIGVGLDNATAAVIEDSARVYDVTGLTAAAVVDLDTYGAAGASYPGGILSLRAGVLHLLPPGDNSYDLASRTPTLDGAPVDEPDLAGRNLGFVAGPANSSALFIAGDLTSDTGGTVVQAFAALASVQPGQTLVVGLGDPNGSGQSLASNWKEPLRRAGIRRVEAVSLTTGMSQKALDAVARQVQNAGALMVVSDQQSFVAELVDELNYVGVKARWQAGVPVLMDNGAAAAAGQWMSANPTPSSDELEDQGSESFLLAGSPYVVDVRAGLGMIPGAAFEPRALVDYRYGRLASLIHADPDLVTFGIDRATALLITADGAEVLGDNGVLVIDGRYAELGEGDNDAIGAAWLIVDTYAPDETLE